MSVSDRQQPGDRPERRPASMIERLRSLFGMGHGSVREDIEDALEEGEDPDAFSPQERVMLRNVLDLHELRVADVMVPRADIIAIELAMTLGQVLTTFHKAGHSRLPVYGDTLDDARGMVHIRDFVAYLTVAPREERVPENGAPENLPRTSTVLPSSMDVSAAALGKTLQECGLVRPVLFVPPSMQALDLLVRMQAFRTHMALVIDEYGGTDGLVSIEDIVEMIVGDIEDEHDESESPKILAALDGSFIADARASLDEVSTAIGVDLLAEENAEEVETLGGLIGTLAGHVPGRGEVIRGLAPVEFEVLDADPRRVKRVRIVRIEAVPAATPAPDARTDGSAAAAERPSPLAAETPDATSAA